MKLKSAVAYRVCLFLFICLCFHQATAQSTSDSENKSAINGISVKTTKLEFLDANRNRVIPVLLYSAIEKGGSQSTSKKIAIINHGYGGKNTDYFFIASNLVARGYVVASIQHELPSDEPLPTTTDNIYEARKPSWERGAQNILFVIQELKKTNPNLNYKKLLLIGHSHGGDTIMIFVREHSKLVNKVISLDNRRVPIPRVKKPKILSIRSSDQVADSGVLPTLKEQKKFNIKIIKLENTFHNDMWDGGTAVQKQQINEIISRFLEN